MVNISSLNLALYPTDWSGENFSVDRASGGGAVKLVDLENIVSVAAAFLFSYLESFFS